MTDFTPEFIAAELEKAAKATPRPYSLQPLSRGHRILGGEKHNVLADMSGRKHEENGDYLVSAANHYEEALREIERLQYEVDAGQDVVDAGKVIVSQMQARAEAAEKVIRGMFPLWINAMGYCEHGRHSELMAMRNYYNGMANPMTNEDIRLMFSLIPERSGE